MTESYQPPLFEDIPKPMKSEAVGREMLNITTAEDTLTSASGMTALDRVKQRPPKYYNFEANVKDAIALARSTDFDIDDIHLPSDVFENGSISSYLGSALVGHYIDRSEYNLLLAYYEEAFAELCRKPDARESAIGFDY